MLPELEVKFDQPRSGYWDGGAKSGGVFRVEALGNEWVSPKDTPALTSGRIVKWGCWSLNFWFTCGSGRTWKEAASIASRKLRRMLGVPASVRVV